MKHMTPDFRAAIKRRMKALEWTAYRLAQECNGDPGQAVIGKFLNGQTDMRSDNLERVLDAIGLEIREK